MIQQYRRCTETILASFSFRSHNLLNSEASLSLSECRSSSDSNKASSGEVSPYDNNSPVLSERRGGDLAKENEVHSGRVLSTERLFCVPEQYSLVGQVTGRSRDTVSNIWSPTKGEIKQPEQKHPRTFLLILVILKKICIEIYTSISKTITWHV